MFRKFTTVLMITSFTHAFAMSPVQETSAMSKALERTFDEMNYSLNVEWDQKDQKFFETTVDGFEQEIKNLQKEGLTNKQLIEYTLEKIKDKQTQNDVKEIAKVINETEMTSDQARDFALEKLNGTYSQGTSWSGSRLGLKLVLILGVIILICAATKHKDKDDDHHHRGDHGKKDDHDNDYCDDDYNYNDEYNYGGNGQQCYPTPS